ncbi:endosome-associated-trafficking regulator 1 isoform X2 [Lissotriton helveticus]
MAAYGFWPESVQSTRTKIGIAQEDQTVQDQDEANPFSFKHFVKSNKLVKSMEENQKKRAFKKPDKQAELPQSSVLPKTKNVNLEFHKPFFRNPTVDPLLDNELRDDSDDDWNESYEPSFIEQVLKPDGTISIERNNFDSFSLTSANLSDGSSWQLNKSRAYSPSLPSLSRDTTECCSLLPDVSQEAANISSSLSDVSHETAESSSFLPDISQGSTDFSSSLPDVFFGKADHILPLLDARLKTPDPDVVAHGDYSAHVRIQSLQVNCDELKEENSQLLMKMEEMQKIHDAQSEKIRILEKKLAEKQEAEEKEAKALESMAQQVEQNLKTMTMRAKVAEGIAVTLKEEIVQLQGQLANYQTENAALRHLENAGLHATRKNAQLALEILNKTIYNAQCSLKQLLSGGESLNFVTDLLKSIDKITELSQEGHC